MSEAKKDTSSRSGLIDLLADIDGKKDAFAKQLKIGKAITFEMQLFTEGEIAVLKMASRLIKQHFKYN